MPLKYTYTFCHHFISLRACSLDAFFCSVIVVYAKAQSQWHHHNHLLCGKTLIFLTNCFLCRTHRIYPPIEFSATN